MKGNRADVHETYGKILNLQSVRMAFSHLPNRARAS